MTCAAYQSSQVGLVYIGDWSKETTITKVYIGGIINVCVRESKTVKSVVAALGTEAHADLFISALIQEK